MQTRPLPWLNDVTPCAKIWMGCVYIYIYRYENHNCDLKLMMLACSKTTCNLHGPILPCMWRQLLSMNICVCVRKCVCTHVWVYPEKQEHTTKWACTLLTAADMIDVAIEVHVTWHMIHDGVVSSGATCQSWWLHCHYTEHVQEGECHSTS